MNSDDYIGAEDKARQRAAVLTRLRGGPLTTLQARSELGVLHVAGRVFELRRAGYAIDTIRTHGDDAQGRRHPIALYVLRAAVGAPCEAP